MSSLLLFVVLLTVLLQPAAAVNPVMDLTLPGSPLDFNMDNLIQGCTCGGVPYDLCFQCLMQLPYNYVAESVQPDDPFDMSLPRTLEFNVDTGSVLNVFNDAAAPVQPDDIVEIPSCETFEWDVQMEPVSSDVTGDNRPILNNKYIEYMAANGTTVQPITVQAHIEDTYTPGDRSSMHPPRSRKRSHRRQAPRDRGFVCNELGCSGIFNRQCDLNRHRKTSHLKKSERPHVCPTCNEGFLYPKDLRRHEGQHSDPSSIKVTFRCEHPDCSNLDGFSRKDNLQRHQRRQHSSQ